MSGEKVMTGQEGKINQPEKDRREAIDYRFLFEMLFCLAGVAAGVLSRSLSLVALAVLSGIDTVNRIIGLFTLEQPPTPPPQKAYFGFSKYHGVLGIVEGAAFIVIGIFIFREAGRRLETNAAAGNFYPAIAVLAAFLIAGFFIPRRKTGLFFIISLAVLAELLVVQFTRVQSLDPVAAIFLAIFILIRSLQSGLKSIKEVMDNRLPQYEEEWIKRLIIEFSGNHFLMHDLKARSSGSNRWIDFHLAASDDTSVEEAFEMAGLLEKELIKKIPGAIVIIHVDPLKGTE